MTRLPGSGLLAGTAPTAAHAATGLWSDPASWPGGKVPGSEDIALISGQITADIHTRVAGIHVVPGGALSFATGSSIRLESTGNVVVEGLLSMRPSSSDVLHTLAFPGVSESRFVGGDAGFTAGQLTRLGGASRVETAALISAASFDPGVDRAYVATGWNFPDALAAGALGGILGAPVLLTGSDALPDVTAGELARLRPKEIVVAGGPAAVSDAVLDQLSGAAPSHVRRVAGGDRFETAAALALEVFEDSAPVVMVTTGANYPDALAGGPAAARLGGPLLLTGQDGLPASTVDALRRLRPDRIIVLGGAAAVSNAVVTALGQFTGGAVERWSGPDRFSTAAAVSKAAFPGGASRAYLTTGGAFPDALAGAPAAAAADAPLLLTGTDALPDATAEEIQRLGCDEVVVLGGAAAVSPAAASAAAVLTSGGGGDASALPAGDVGLWVVGAGALDLAGTERAGWNRTGADSTWRAGDEIRVTPTKKGDTSTFAEFTPGSPVPSGSSSTRAEVFNLTRNVVVEGTAAGRAHVFVRSSQAQSIRHALFRHMGPRGFDLGQDTDQTGRYALHMHHCGEGSRGSVIEGLVIRDSGNHSFVAHWSHGVTFRDCVAYDVDEDAYWWDPPAGQGDDHNNSDDVLYDHCLAAKVSTAAATQSAEFEVTGFYLGGGKRVEARDCAAAGVGGKVNSSGFHWPSKANGIEDNVWEFTDCVAHNNARHGIFVWQNTGTGPHFIDRFHGYNNGGDGINHGAYTNIYNYRDCLLEGNGRNAFTQHAHVAPDNHTDHRPSCENVAFRSAVGVELVAHNIEGVEKGAFRYVGCDFSDAAEKVRVSDGAGPKSGSYDFIRCDLEPSDFEIVNMHPDSLIRVQRGNGTAFQIDGSGTVTSIDPFA